MYDKGCLGGNSLHGLVYSGVKARRNVELLCGGKKTLKKKKNANVVCLALLS